MVCGSGQRAAVAASLLQRYGAEQVIHVVEGGVPRWKREGWPIDEPTPAPADAMLLAIPFGLAIGVSLGMLGGGGSVLAVPVLVYVLGQSVHQATTASLVVVTVGAIAGGLGHARGGTSAGATPAPSPPPHCPGSLPAPPWATRSAAAH